MYRRFFFNFYFVKYERFRKIAAETPVIFFIFLFVFINLWQIFVKLESTQIIGEREHLRKIDEFHLSLNVSLVRSKLESF